MNVVFIMKQPKHLTPCNHLVCESRYPRLNTCPMCRAPLGRLVEEDSDFDIIEVSVELNLRMIMAAHRGHEDIVRLMLFRGANNYNTGLTSAASGDHESIVRLMLDQGATNYNDAMAMAAFSGQVHIVRLMLDCGADDYNETMETAASQGHLNVVELIRERMNSPSS